LRAILEEEKKELYKSMLIAEAAVLDRSSQEDIDSFNKLRKELISLTFPEKARELEKEEKSMTEIFNTLFRDEKGKPKPIQVNVGESYGKDFETENYLKTISKK